MAVIETQTNRLRKTQEQTIDRSAGKNMYVGFRMTNTFRILFSNGNILNLRT